jgi:hypothetical protein
MRNQIIFKIIAISALLITSCRFDRHQEFLPRLPVTINSSSIVNNDSSTFSIAVRDDSILIFDNSSSKHIKSFESIGDFVCTEINSGKISFQNNYPATLIIDSLTPYPVFDKLMEELELLGFQAPFLKTSSKGFWVVFPYKDEILQEEVAKLYGTRFLRKRNVMTECQKDFRKNDSTPDLPPPPGLNYGKLRTINYLDSLECLVEINGHDFRLNRKSFGQKKFRIELSKRKIVYIKLNKNNVYNDLIKIIDIIKGVEAKRFNDYSVNILKMKFSDLEQDEQRKIKRECGFRYLILSLAEQNFINKN